MSQDFLENALKRRSDWLSSIIPSPSDLPLGVSDGWTLERFTIENDARMQLANLRMAVKGVGDRAVVPGDYYRLWRGDTLVMTDTPAEKSDHVDFVRRSTGRVLIGGLGMGMVLNAVALRDEVEHVTVIEIADGPINLVWEYYREKFGDKITLIHDDVLTWKPYRNERWDHVWMDIWDTICADDYEQHKLLRRRYAQKADNVGVWAGELVRELYRRG